MPKLWCLQCGVQNRPVQATGRDEEGDPACNTHRVEPFKEEAKSEAVKTEEPNMERICKCGCGGKYTPTSNVQKFIKGHKPKPGKSPLKPTESLNGAPSKVVKANGNGHSQLILQEAQLDRILAVMIPMMPFEQKKHLLDEALAHA